MLALSPGQSAPWQASVPKWFKLEVELCSPAAGMECEACGARHALTGPTGNLHKNMDKICTNLNMDSFYCTRIQKYAQNLQKIMQN